MKKFTVIILLSILLVGVVGAWTWQKVGSVYVVTLTSGIKVNVTNITYVNTTINAVVQYKTLSIQDVKEIADITKNITDNAKGKAQKYDTVRIICSK